MSKSKVSFSVYVPEDENGVPSAPYFELKDSLSHKKSADLVSEYDVAELQLAVKTLFKLAADLSFSDDWDSMKGYSVYTLASYLDVAVSDFSEKVYDHNEAAAAASLAKAKANKE